MSERVSPTKDYNNDDYFSDFYRNRYDSQIIAPAANNDPLLRRAFAAIDRAHFLPDTADVSFQVYEDEIIPLQDGSTISQPSLVATMLKSLTLNGSGTGLEVGTASGYNAAVMAQCMDQVVTIEYDEQLAQFAKGKLLTYGIDNVNVITGDGLIGAPDKAPFDRIIVTAGLRSIPTTLTNQLADGGIMVAPVGRKHQSSQELLKIEKQNGDITSTVIEPVRFVPVMSELPGGWTYQDMVKVREQQVAFFNRVRLDYSEVIAKTAKMHNLPISEELIDYFFATFPFPDWVYDDTIKL